MDYVESRRAMVAAVPTYIVLGVQRATHLVPEALLPPDVTQPPPDWRTSVYRDPSTDFGLDGAGIRYHTFFPDVMPFADSVFGAWADDLGIDVSIERDRYVGSRLEPPLSERQLVSVQISTTSPLIGVALRGALGAFGTAHLPAEFRRLVADLEQAEGDTDPVSRLERLLAIEQELLDQAYVLPQVSEVAESRVALQPWVRGFDVSPFGGSTFADVWFTTDAPDRDIPSPTR